MLRLPTNVYRSPARFVAAGGDVELQGAIRSARPVRLLATGDVAMTGSNSTSGLEVQHQPERLDGSQPVGLSELSLIQAEHLSLIGAWTGQAPIAPERLRRNLVISGINVAAMHSLFRQERFVWRIGE